MNAKTADRIWTKPFILAFIAAMFPSLSMSMLDGNMALFAGDMWNSNTLGGLLSSFFTAGGIIMAFFSGRLVDRKGRRNCYILGAVLFAASTFLIALLPTQAAALTARFFQGVAKGIVTVASASIVADVVPPERLGEGMAYYGLGSALPRAFGPMLGLNLSAGGHYARMFAVSSLVYLLAAAVALGINYEKSDDHKRKLAERKAASPAKAAPNDYKGVWKLIEKRALPASINNTVYFGSVCCVIVFLTIYARDILLMDTNQISLFYIMSSASMVAVRLFAGRVADRIGVLPVIVPGHIASILMLLMLGLWVRNNFFLFLLTAVLSGASSAAIQPTLGAVAVTDSPVGRAGAANASYFFMMDFGALLATTTFGTLIDGASTRAMGYTLVFVISACACTFSLVLSLLFFNEKARAKRRGLNGN